MQSEEENRKQNPMTIFQRLIREEMKEESLSLERARKILKQILFRMKNEGDK